MPDSARLSVFQLVVYSAPSLATSVAALPMLLFVPAFYSDDLGIPLAAVGGAIAASRLLDVVTDLAIGTLSDRLRLPLGRRKSWMALGLPLFFALVGFTFIRLAAESAVRAGTAPPPSLSTPRAARHFNPGRYFLPLIPSPYTHPLPLTFSHRRSPTSMRRRRATSPFSGPSPSSRTVRITRHHTTASGPSRRSSRITIATRTATTTPTSARRLRNPIRARANSRSSTRSVRRR